MYRDLGCVIYVELGRNELLEELRKLLSAKSTQIGFYSHDNEIDVVRNLDNDSVERHNTPDGFLHFQHRVELFPDESKSISLENQIELASMILRHLWANAVPAVASCGYEDRLPENGGYKTSDSYA